MDPAFRYGNLGSMKKTLNIDDDLLRRAREASGAATDTETVRLGLKAMLQKAAYERLAVLKGTQPGASKDVPRRREPPVNKAGRRRIA